MKHKINLLAFICCFVLVNPLMGQDETQPQPVYGPGAPKQEQQETPQKTEVYRKPDRQNVLDKDKYPKTDARIKAEREEAHRATIAHQSWPCNQSVLWSGERQLGGRGFVYTEPFHFRVHNSDEDHLATLQLGRRHNNKVFLFIKLTKHNSCLKKDDVVEFIFSGTKYYTLENEYDVNCDGVFVKELNPKDVRALMKSRIQSFMVATFGYDMEFHLIEEQDHRLKSNIRCLTNYDF